jgi:hypothetical protein
LTSRQLFASTPPPDRLLVQLYSENQDKTSMSP